MPRKKQVRVIKVRILTWFLTLTACLGTCMAGPAIAGTTQSLDSIKQAAIDHARMLAHRQSMNVVAIETGRLDTRLRLSSCDQALETFSPFDATFSHRTTIGVRCNSDKPWTVYVPVTVASEVEALVLTRAVGRGDILRRSDVSVRRQRQSKSGMAFFQEPDMVIGKQAKRFIQAGTVLTPAMIAEPIIVKRGDTVPIVASLGGLSVTSSGEALASAAAGDVIRLKNGRSGRTVEGRVQADGSVAIRTGQNLK